MKKMINLLAISLLVIFYGCSSGSGSYYDDEYYNVESTKTQTEENSNTDVNTENTQPVEDKYLVPEESSGNEDLSRSDYSAAEEGAAVNQTETYDYRDTTAIPIVDNTYYDDEGNEVELNDYSAPIDESVEIGSGYRRYLEYYYPTVVTVDYVSYYDPFYYDPYYYYSPGWSFSIGFGGYYGGWGWGISWGWGGYYPPYYGYYPPYYGYYPPYYCDPYYGGYYGGYYDGYYGYVPSETRYRDNYNGDLRNNRGGRGSSTDLTRTSAATREVGLDGLAVSDRGGSVGRSGGGVDVQRKGRSSELDRAYVSTSAKRDLELASMKAERREAVERGTDVKSGRGTTKTKGGGYTVQAGRKTGEISSVSNKGRNTGSTGGRTATVSGKRTGNEIAATGRKGISSSSNRVPKDYGRTAATKTSRKTTSSRNSVESYYSKSKRSGSSVKSSSRYSTGVAKKSSRNLNESSRKTTRSSSYSSSTRKTKSSSSVSSRKSSSSSGKVSSRRSSSRSSSKSYSAPSRKSSKSYSSPSRSSGKRSSSYRSGSSSHSRSSSYGSRSSSSYRSSGSRSSGSRSSGARSSGSRSSSGGGRRR